jgi:hypothetical protein
MARLPISVCVRDGVHVRTASSTLRNDSTSARLTHSRSALVTSLHDDLPLPRAALREHGVGGGRRPAARAAREERRVGATTF